MRSLFLISLFTSVFSTAQAETFVCAGSGRFSSMNKPHGQVVELEWPQKIDKTVFDNGALRVNISIDKSNTDGTHYLQIAVVEPTDKPEINGGFSFRAAKGSLKDMVLYIDSVQSMVTCVPVK